VCLRKLQKHRSVAEEVEEPMLAILSTQQPPQEDLNEQVKKKIQKLIFEDGSEEEDL